jgi:hypothetical protein
MREFAMKTLLLASAAVLSLGVGSAAAATTGIANDRPATTIGTGNNPSSDYAYYTPQGLMPRTEAPPLPQPRPTPWDALEAYASDNDGAGG